jgi:hypothetical protein
MKTRKNQEMLRLKKEGEIISKKTPRMKSQDGEWKTYNGTT